MLGGTFDPVHFGHLHPAKDILEQLALDEVRLIPCGTPVHRGTPMAAARHRWQMLNLAVADYPGLKPDDRELQRGGASYSIDTLVELRSELGPRTTLCFAMGVDAFNDLASWHRWRELLEFTHIVVMTRPGAELTEEDEVAELLQTAKREQASDLAGEPCGGVLFCEVSRWDVSATEIRALIARGQRPRDVLPEVVWDYIREHGLYDGDTH